MLNLDLSRLLRVARVRSREIRPVWGGSGPRARPRRTQLQGNGCARAPETSGAANCFSLELPFKSGRLSSGQRASEKVCLERKIKQSKERVRAAATTRRRLARLNARRQEAGQ